MNQIDVEKNKKLNKLMEKVNSPEFDLEFSQEEIQLLKEIAVEHEGLLKHTKIIARMSDIQGKELIKKENEIKCILNASDQGFLVFGSDYIIEKSFSSECEKIFEKNISGKNVLEILRTEDETVNTSFEKEFKMSFREKEERFCENYFERLPKRIVIKNKYIDLKYKIINKQKERMIMLILTDETKKVKADEQLYEAIYLDKLTSLYNRAYFEKIFSSNELSHCETMGMIFADMNGLKFINDVFGHQKGDELLVCIADIIRKSCRKSEIIIRWGGDEFVIVLPDATEKICKNICDRIRKSCEQTNFELIQPSVATGYSVQNIKWGGISEIFNMAENDMYRNKTKEDHIIKTQITSNIEKFLSKKCAESNEHLKTIEILSVRLAELVGIRSSYQIEEVKMLARLHDVGKIIVPHEVFEKETELTSEEWEKMKNIGETGYRIAFSIGEAAIAQYILYVHENWDGTGYPYGIKGNEIPIMSRIISIVEAYEVMISGRNYKIAKSSEEAIEEIKKCRGTRFDPVLVDHFITMNLDLIEKDE